MGLVKEEERMMQEYSGKVLRVVDGDTVDCIIDLGFDISIRKRCRLHGIDTPEVRSKDPDQRALGIECKLKLEGASLSKALSEYSIISVHKLEDLIVPKFF